MVTTESTCSVQVLLCTVWTTQTHRQTWTIRNDRMTLVECFQWNYWSKRKRMGNRRTMWTPKYARVVVVWTRSYNYMNENEWLDEWRWCCTILFLLMLLLMTMMMMMNTKLYTVILLYISISIVFFVVTIVCIKLRWRVKKMMMMTKTMIDQGQSQLHWHCNGSRRLKRHGFSKID